MRLVWKAAAGLSGFGLTALEGKGESGEDWEKASPQGPFLKANPWDRSLWPWTGGTEL